MGERGSVESKTTTGFFLNEKTNGNIWYFRTEISFYMFHSVWIHWILNQIHLSTLINFQNKLSYNLNLLFLQTSACFFRCVLLFRGLTVFKYCPTCIGNVKFIEIWGKKAADDTDRFFPLVCSAHRRWLWKPWTSTTALLLAVSVLLPLFIIVIHPAPSLLCFLWNKCTISVSDWWWFWAGRNLWHLDIVLLRRLSDKDQNGWCHSSLNCSIDVFYCLTKRSHTNKLPEVPLSLVTVM